MIIWLMMALTVGGLVFAGVIFWALREPAERVLCLPVRENTMEYALWQAELQVQLGFYGAVELTGIPMTRKRQGSAVCSCGGGPGCGLLRRFAKALRVYYTKNYHRFFHLERKEWTDSRQRFWKER